MWNKPETKVHQGQINLIRKAKPGEEAKKFVCDTGTCPIVIYGPDDIPAAVEWAVDSAREQLQDQLEPDDLESALEALRAAATQDLEERVYSRPKSWSE